MGDRATPATTIRPQKDQQPSSTTGTRSPSKAQQAVNNFDTIMGLLKQEQSARQRLEGHVLDLQRELNELRTPIYAYIQPAMIPTPTSELQHSKTVALKARTLHRAPPFARDKGFDRHEMSRFSMTDTDEGSMSGTDDGSNDVYGTPHEKRFTFETSRTFTSARSSPRSGVTKAQHD